MTTIEPGVVERLASEICMDVAELPDRTSPDDWPEAMLVTAEELHAIVTSRLEALLAQQQARIAELEAENAQIKGNEYFAKGYQFARALATKEPT